MIEIACGHPICSRCSTAASLHGHAKCPLCRAPHNLDVAELRQRLAAYREEYSAWRSGDAAGVKGELAHIVQKPDAEGALSTLDSQRPCGRHPRHGALAP
jgi:transcription elongation factor Elf1